MKKDVNNSKKIKKRCKLTERDIRLLRYLWKWKTLSTEALAVKFFPNAKRTSAYRRLMRLEGEGFIQAIDTTDYFKIVWVLTLKGFRRIRPFLGELSSEGFKSENILHDHLSTAFHLGEWLTHQPDYTQTFSEQQMRRISMELWDDWVPKSDSHRPDGYSLYFQGQTKIIVSFETELTLKDQKRYGSVFAFYDVQKSIQLVFWLIKSRTVLNSFKLYFEKLQGREWSKHHFVLVSDFLEKGWSAPFIEGRFQGKTLLDFLPRQGITKVSLGSTCGDTMTLLNTAKKPINSEASDDLKKLQSSN